MGYLRSSQLARARGGYGTRMSRSRGGFPLAALGLSLLGKGIKKYGGKAVKYLGKAAGVGATAVTLKAAIAPPAAPPGMVETGGVRGAIQRALPGGESGFQKRRRMNVANPKALRRAIRRTDGFVKLAKRTLKGTGFTVARRGLSRAAKTRKR